MRRLALPVALLTLVSCGGDTNGGGTTPTQPVTPVATTIEVSSASITLESLGATSTLTATVKDQNGAAMTGQTVSWASSDVAVATVSNGTVTAVANGSATVTATSGSLSASASVTVSQVAASVAITPSALSFVSLTDTVSVSGQIADALGNPMEGGSDPITWSMSDTTVASVSAEGLVTSVGNGSGSITATSGALTGSAAVIVDQVAASLTLSEDSVTFRSITDSLLVSATGADALGSSMDSVAVAWTTSDAGVATVTDGLVRPIANGTASITATAGDVTATLSVVVGIEYFYLAENGVTVMCPDAAVGDTGVVNGITYTKRDRAFLDAVIAASNYAPLARVCTSGITDMSYLFYRATAFNEPIGTWDVSDVTIMNHMFMEASAFNQDISAWDVRRTVTMFSTFYLATSFNGDISNWDVGAVTTMKQMFVDARVFNSDISQWDVSQVTDMYLMFVNARSFNQDVSKWNVGSVTDMTAMLSGAESFNHDLSTWCTTNIPDVPSDFDTSAFSWTLPRPVWGTCSPASLFQSTLSASSASIPADGASTVTLTVQLKDLDGVNLTENSRVLTFDTPALGSITTPIVNGDGSFTATYTAGNTDAMVTITAVLDGMPMTQTVTITLN